MLGKLLCQKAFANGVVYGMETDDGYPIEVTDTHLPFYTKDAVGRKQNAMVDGDFGSRAERWMIGVSTMSGCPVGCGFCATGSLDKYRKLTASEIIHQVSFVLGQNPRYRFVNAKEHKVNYTRMGEPFLNIAAVREAIADISRLCPGTHHYVSTVGIRGSDFSWVKDDITLQISLHSLNEERRHELIPISGLMSIAELGQIRTKSKLKTTVNLTLIDDADFDIVQLRRHFDPAHFFIKLSPINPSAMSVKNGLGDGIIKANYIKEKS